MSSESPQTALRLAWGVHRGPVDAPRKIVAACLAHDDPLPMALAVSMRAGGHKLASVAAATGFDVSYVCLLRSGKRRITKELVAPLCAATGSNLLRQVWDATASMDADDERREIERMAALLASVA